MKPWVWIGLVCLLAARSGAESPSPSAAGSPMEQKILKASEAGRLEEVKRLRRELADQNRAQGAWAEAERQYELLLASRPPKRERVAYFVELGKIREAMEDWGGAIEAYEDALHDDPRAFEARMRLGSVYARTDLYAPAEFAFVSARRQNPRSFEPWLGLGRLYLRRGYLERAVTSLLEARRLAPKDLETALTLAEAYRHQGATDQAESVLQEALRVSESPGIYSRLGDLYRARGQWEPAAAAWRKALEQQPLLPEVRLNLVLALEQMGRRQESEARMEALVHDFPESALVHFWRAWLYLEHGNPAAARRAALDVRRLRPSPLVADYTERLLKKLES